MHAKYTKDPGPQQQGKVQFSVIFVIAKRVTSCFWKATKMSIVLDRYLST